MFIVLYASKKKTKHFINVVMSYGLRFSSFFFLIFIRTGPSVFCSQMDRKSDDFIISENTTTYPTNSLPVCWAMSRPNFTYAEQKIVKLLKTDINQFR